MTAAASHASSPGARLSQAARRDVLAATPLFRLLDTAELDALTSLVTEHRVRRDALVMRRGDAGSSLLILVHGRLRAGTTSADGREVTMGLIEPGGVLGEMALLDGQPRSLDVIAMADSLLLSVERSAFLPFLRARPDLTLRLMALLCSRLRQINTAFEDLALLPLPARLARLLLGLAEQHGTPVANGVRLRIRLSQRDIGTQVAATRERVNKQLRHWHEAGVLDEQDGHLVVCKPAVLRALLDAPG